MQVKKNVKKLVVLITFLIAGFFGHYISNRSTPLNSQDEAASVMVSVSNVVPWFQIADAMRPDFELGGG